MIKISVPVVVSRVREDKVKGKNYVDFLFLGGALTVPVDSSQFSKLSSLVGREIPAVFVGNPRSVVLFDRSQIVFEASKILEFGEK